MIYNWHNHPIVTLATYLMLGLMSINPALALQYQQFNQTTDFLSKIPDYLPTAYYIHTSQKDEVLALLAKQGYRVIPASREDARHFLTAHTFSNPSAIQLAANFNLHQVYENACSHKKIYCYREECGKYPKERRKDCPEDAPPAPTAGNKPSTETTGQKSSTRTRISVSHSQGFSLPNLGGGGGGKGDAAAVMLIVIGVVVIAALFIYAGKWIADLLSNDEDYYAYWWDIGTQFITLDTGANQHGDFSGLKFSGGFIANRLAHFGLAAEIGRMDLDLQYNRNSMPQRINLEGTYWLLGPTVRWLLGNIDTEKAINNSYFYLELLGGSSDRKEVDMLAVARVGFNTGLGAHLRIGLHYGAFYLGLDEDQGFANDGDNYWNMYGLELGYQF